MCSRLRVSILVACLSAIPGTARGQGPYRLPVVAGLDEFLAIPDDNRLTPSRIALGARLFFDSLLSRDRSVACASCHLPGHGFADTLALSRGVGGRIGRRNAPTILNRGYGVIFFLDGRAESLESQVLEPIRDTRK